MLVLTLGGVAGATSVQIASVTAFGNNTFGSATNVEGEFDVAPNLAVVASVGVSAFQGNAVMFGGGAKYYVGSLDARATPFVSARVERVAGWEGYPFFTASAALGYRLNLGNVFGDTQVGFAVPLGPFAVGTGARGTALSVRSGFGFRF